MPGRVPPIERASGVRVRMAGRDLVSFAGCDTLGLARDPRPARAAAEALERFGVGAAASPATTGVFDVHRELEAELAAWTGTQDAVLLSCGWLAPTAAARVLAPRCDLVLLPPDAHPALRDAAALTGLPVEPPGVDPPAGRALILTASVDIVRGCLAPLARLAALAQETGGRLVVDDAHGIGVLGPGGRGAAALAQLDPARVVVAGSLAKAIGCHGGFVAADRETCDSIRRAEPSRIGATTLPPAIAAAALAAVRLAAAGDDLRERLFANSRLLAKRLREFGFPGPQDDVPWMSLLPAAHVDLDRVAAALWDAGFLAPRTNYPGTPQGGAIRLAVSAAHSTEEIEAFAAALRA